jgi:CRISPR-associated exonuclease Cas4
MFTEDELLPISALQHLAFCKRQWGLIHLEGVWKDNVLTAEGILMHEKAHGEDAESRPDIRIARALRVRSLRLGIVGQTDIVEFHKTEDVSNSITLPGVSGLWFPKVIEYKHGKPKIGIEDEVQLCAQCLCLEEMLNVKLTSASFFYGQPRRRQNVVLNRELREKTEELITLLRDLTAAGRTPEPEYSSRCRNCSLVEYCLPKIAGHNKSVKKYIQKMIEINTGESNETTS